MMQITRRHIITYLNEKGPATVDELAEAVGLTPMAVRHHLNILQVDNLITASVIRKHNGPGRPSQVYQLTEAADPLFPTDYHGLTDYLLSELTTRLGAEGVVNIFESIAARLVHEVPPPKPQQTLENRLDEVVGFLNQKGFVSEWEVRNDSYLIHTYSCPYRQVAKKYSEVCILDKQIISTMLNTAPARTACLTSADGHCTYQISKPIELFME